MVDETEIRLQTKKRRKITYDEGVRITDPDKHFKPPPGCVDVWQLTSYDGRVNRHYGILKDYDKALATAKRFIAHKGLRANMGLSVMHKAAIELTPGHFHLVHFHPIKWRDENDFSSKEESWTT